MNPNRTPYASSRSIGRLGLQVLEMASTCEFIADSPNSMSHLENDLYHEQLKHADRIIGIYIYILGYILGYIWHLADISKTHPTPLGVLDLYIARVVLPRLSWPGATGQIRCCQRGAPPLPGSWDHDSQYMEKKGSKPPTWQDIMIWNILRGTIF